MSVVGRVCEREIERMAMKNVRYFYLKRRCFYCRMEIYYEFFLLVGRRFRSLNRQQRQRHNEPSGR